MRASVQFTVQQQGGTLEQLHTQATEEWKKISGEEELPNTAEMQVVADGSLRTATVIVSTKVASNG